MNILQHIVFPNFDIDAPESLYVRTQQGILISRADKTITFLQKGVTAYFDTYFNSFTIQTWKNKTPIRQLKLRLFGKGEVFIKIKRNKLHSECKPLSEFKIELTENGADIDFADLNQHIEGMLFFELTSISETVELTGGFYHTDMPPVNNVKLGAVVTHFNRKNYVLPAIERVSKGLLQDPYYQDKISLIVVDNSQNITPEEAQHAIVLPNQNLGGSGGFTRGLMYLEEEKNYTHCLFMDDDASCEIESIRRAYALLQYATEEKFAIAGAQLRETFPSILHEKGGIVLKNGVAPLFQGRDMSFVHELLWVEDSAVSADYGAWWFFAFPIKHVEKYSFPFFVRGDDISFSLTNKFKVTTLNGIGVWGEDFFVKESPMTRYLGFRSFLVCQILAGQKTHWYRFMKQFRGWYWSCVTAYNYSSAEAVVLAVKDVLAGSKTFAGDVGASNVRAQLAQLPQDEKMNPIVRTHYDITYAHEPSNKKRRMRRWISKLTLNYLLLPERFMKQGMVFQHKHFGANTAQTYRYKHIYYENEASRTGYIATFNKERLLKAYIEYFKTLWLIYQNFDAAKADYISQKDKLTSREFWEEIYSQDKKS